MKPKNLAILGPYPPPLGGISVHIERISKWLIQKKIPFTIFNYGFSEDENVVPTRKNPIFYAKFLFKKSFNLIHFHNSLNFEYVYYYLFSKLNSTPILLTIHSEKILDSRPLTRSFYLYFLKHTKFTKLISVSEGLSNFLNQQNIPTEFLPAYVPPYAIQPKKIEKDGRILFLFSVWRLSREEAEKVYNVPLVFEFLKQNKDQFKMLFMIGSKASSDLDYLNELTRSFEVEEDIEILFDQNIVNYVQNCSFLLRANLSDAYGISLQEAMDLGVPAIASDVCARPKGTILFRSGDLEDMTQKIFWLSKQSVDTLLKFREDLHDHEKLIEIYQTLLC